MSKKQQQKAAKQTRISAPQPAAEAPVTAFGYEEMLSELEAIVAEAEVRLATEAELA